MVEAMESPRNYGALAILVTQTLQVARSKPTPPVVDLSQNLKPLHLITLFDHWPYFVVYSITIFLQSVEQLYASVPVFEGSVSRIKHIFVDMND